MIKHQEEVTLIMCVVFICSSLHEYKESNFLTQQAINTFDLCNSSIMLEERFLHFRLFADPHR